LLENRGKWVILPFGLPCFWMVFVALAIWAGSNSESCLELQDRKNSWISQQLVK